MEFYSLDECLPGVALFDETLAYFTYDHCEVGLMR